jgi:hypothetical protein
MIEAVRKYALEHYHEDGWDILVECWNNHDIAEVIRYATTVAEAIEFAHRAVTSLDDYRQDIINA